MPITPRIVLIEDDPVQAEWIADVMLKCFQEDSPTSFLKYFDSEYSFLKAVPSLRDWDPQIALIDRSIRYCTPDDVKGTDPSIDFENLPNPDEAWMRCRDPLMEVSSEIRVAVMTVHDAVPGTCADDLVIQKGDNDMEVKLIQFLVQNG